MQVGPLRGKSRPRSSFLASLAMLTDREKREIRARNILRARAQSETEDSSHPQAVLPNIYRSSSPPKQQPDPRGGPRPVARQARADALVNAAVRPRTPVYEYDDEAAPILPPNRCTAHIHNLQAPVSAPPPTLAPAQLGSGALPLRPLPAIATRRLSESESPSSVPPADSPAPPSEASSSGPCLHLRMDTPPVEHRAESTGQHGGGSSSAAAAAGPSSFTAAAVAAGASPGGPTSASRPSPSESAGYAIDGYAGPHEPFDEDGVSVGGDVRRWGDRSGVREA